MTKSDTNEAAGRHSLSEWQDNAHCFWTVWRREEARLAALEDPVAFVNEANNLLHEYCPGVVVELEGPPADGALVFSANGDLEHFPQVLALIATGMMDTPRTTLVAAVVQRGQLHWVHCGDSRMYVVRGGQLLKRTRDHSYLEAKAGTGMPVKDVNRNVLFTCLGSTVRPMFDVGGPIVLQDQDRVMLCSDGLWGTLDDDTITRGMSERPLAEGMPLLIEQALRKGGPRCDNVTVIALEWEAAKSRSKRVRPGFIETGSMDDSEFASTIQPVSGMPDSALDELDDEAIERSIAEINEAIQRTALKKT